MESDEKLRAKYLDYCSAKVADVLLAMSADDIFVMAQEAARESDRSGELSYEEMVRLATERVSRGLALPPFEEWVELYRRDPGTFDRQLMGLWEDPG